MIAVIQGIYKIISPTNRIYIGQSKNIFRRFCEYKGMRFSKRQRKLYLSFIKHGVYNHKFEIIHESIDQNDRNKLEEYYIDLFNCVNNGLNCKRGGLHVPMTDEIKANIGKANKGKKSCLGRFMSEETRKKIGDANRGKKHPNCKKKTFSEKGIEQRYQTRKIIFHNELGIYFNGLEELSFALNITKTNLKYYLSGYGFKVSNNKPNIQYI